MKFISYILQIGLGLMLLAFGLNKFFWIMPGFNFSEYPEAEHLFSTLRYSGEDPEAGKGYIMHLVGGSEAIIGLLLISNKWVPFALVMLAPISVNLIMFHVMVNLANIGPAILVAAMNTYLIYLHWDSYRSIFK